MLHATDPSPVPERRESRYHPGIDRATNAPAIYFQTPERGMTAPCIGDI